MNKFCVLLLIVFLSIVSGRRLRRQSEDDLEDKYGFNRPSWQRPSDPWTRPSDPWGRPININTFPDRNPTPTRRPVTTTTQASDGVTTESPEVLACQRRCPGTPEYNPVCGTNGKDYDNPGRLFCAQMCGVSVTLLRQAKCPTTPAPIL